MCLQVSKFGLLPCTSCAIDCKRNSIINCLVILSNYLLQNLPYLLKSGYRGTEWLKTLVPYATLYASENPPISASENSPQKENSIETQNTQSHSQRPSPPRYLFVLEYAEQLTKASKGLQEVLWLARALNRTFVLPFVGSSMIGFRASVHKFPLSFYFDIRPIQDYVKTVSYGNIIFLF